MQCMYRGFFISFIVLFSCSVPAYEGYTEGYWFKNTTTNIRTAAASQQIDLASNLNYSGYIYTATSVRPAGSTNYYLVFTPTNPNGAPYEEVTQALVRYSCAGYESQTYCQPPPSECPDQGDVVRIGQVINGSYDSNGNFLEDLPADGTITIGGSVSADGCGFAISTDNTFDADSRCEKFDDTAILCWKNVISTGEPLDPVDGQPYSQITENLTNQETAGSSDTRNDSSSVIISDPVVSDDGSGNVVTTEQTQTTETKGSGTVIQETSTSVNVTDSDGIIKNETTTQTTYQNSDGTKEIVTETTTNYTQSPITNYTIDNSTGDITINTSGGSSASQTTTQTDTYDSSGNLSGSTSQTTGDSDQEVGEEGSYCEENPESPDCKDYEGPSGEGEYEPTDLTYSTVLGGFKDRFTNSPLGVATVGFFDVTITGSCPVWAADVPMLGSITFDFFCGDTADVVLAVLSWALLIIASIAAYRIAIL